MAATGHHHVFGVWNFPGHQLRRRDEEHVMLTKEDAKKFDCVSEIRHGRKILKRGTSAHRQLAVYHKAVKAGAEPQEALRKVVDFLIKETVAGL